MIVMRHFLEKPENLCEDCCIQQEKMKKCCVPTTAQPASFMKKKRHTLHHVQCRTQQLCLDCPVVKNMQLCICRAQSRLTHHSMLAGAQQQSLEFRSNESIWGELLVSCSQQILQKRKAHSTTTTTTTKPTTTTTTTMEASSNSQ